MPITANNLIIKSENNNQNLLPEPTMENINNEPEKAPILVVNGKGKKLGKHSQYLIDMLTIDEE